MAEPLSAVTGRRGFRPSLRFLLEGLLGLLTLLYPFAVYFGMSHFGTRTLALLLLGLLGLRLLVWLGPRQRAVAGLWPMMAAIAVLCLLVLVRGDGRFFLYYPVAVNLTMLVSFALTLSRPPSMIERFARLREPEMPPVAIVYCRRVTQVWCGFFVVNGLVSLATVLHGQLKLWTLYNGLISYSVMGLLFAGEMVVRTIFKRRHADAVRGG